MLVVLDLETTGLDPEREEILEVAAIVVDDKLEEVARFEYLVSPEKHPDLYTIDPFVYDMHTKSGLLDELRKVEANRSEALCEEVGFVDGALADFIRKHAVKLGRRTVGSALGESHEEVTLDRPQLCGNTISFDRAFMKKYLPEAHAELHYRNVDVSSLNEVARRFFPGVYAATKQSKPDGKGKEHRAMWDAMCSLAQLRAYTKLLAPVLDRDAAADRVRQYTEGVDEKRTGMSAREWYSAIADAALGRSS